MEKLMFSSHTIGLQLQMMKMYGNDGNNVIQCLFIFVLIDGIHSCIHIYICLNFIMGRFIHGTVLCPDKVIN